MVKFIQQAWLVILLGLVFGVALAGVNSALKPRIEANERNARQQAVKAIFGDDVQIEQVEVEPDGGEDGEPATYSVFQVLHADGSLAGWAVPAQGGGYADTIKLIVGVGPDASTIRDFRVIYNQETPGLGNKIVDDNFRQRFEGKTTLEQLTATQQPDGSETQIQAITGATISSQAVADIIYQNLAPTGLAETLAGLAGGSKKGVQ